MNLVALAEEIATKAHEGQVDKAGQPYIEHPRRVAARVTPELQPVAWLHDVVEDTDVTLEFLAAVFPGWIVDAVEALTHRPGEPRSDYYRRVAANDAGRQVKLADIADNSDTERLAQLDPATRARLEAKYAKALLQLR